jgi:hypothetical protein
MKPARFVLQSEPVLTIEKYACKTVSNNYLSCLFSDVSHLSDDDDNVLVPVGSVEFVKEFCKHLNICLSSESFSYYEPVRPFLKRDVRKTTLGEADSAEFVKPVGVKTFTGDVKNKLRPLSPLTGVWAAPVVPFESEFRYYVVEQKIVGWSRYDDVDCTNPDPPQGLVEQVVSSISDFDEDSPRAYSVDIGWRPDLGLYDVVELNDAWALGLYRNSDPQSFPPSYEDYARMLVSRWNQLKAK